MMDHLPILLVVVPLISAPICFLISDARLAWQFTCLVAVVCLVISLVLVGVYFDSGTIRYEVGGWAAPWGIEYRIDALSLIAILLVTITNLFATAFAGRSIENDIALERRSLFYSAWILCVCGLLGIVSTGDIFNVFVFLEISSLSSYVLIAAARNDRCLVAAFRYLILGTIGATFFLVGVGLLYGLTGTLNMSDMAARLPGTHSSAAFAAGLAFLVIGIALKAALFPLHSWMPDAYTYAPSAVSTLLAGTTTKVSVYLLIRILFDIVGITKYEAFAPVAMLLFPIAILAIIVGSAVACTQDNVKRILAWSSISQIGYMVLAISLLTSDGLIATMLHMFNHALMKAALFMAVGCLIWRVGDASFANLAGLGRQMPWTFTAFALASLSLIGIPLTAGFISKWYLVLALIDAQLWLVIAIVLLSSLLAVVYLGRVIEVLWFRTAAPSKDAVAEAPWWLLAPTFGLVIANFWFGLSTQMQLGLAQSGATLLSGGQP